MDRTHQRFALHLDRTYLRALDAMVAIGPADPDPAMVERVRSQRGEIESRLIELGPDNDPMCRLADRLQMPDLVRDFLWSAVAVATDPRIVTHLVALVGPHVRRGLSPAGYAVLAKLDHDDARELGLALGPHHPLFRAGILSSAEEQTSRSGTPLTVADRLISYLAGRDMLDPGLAGAGQVLSVSDRMRYDDGQQEALRQLADGLDESAPLLVIVQGRIDSGRRTAAARVATQRGRPVVSLDLTRVQPSIAGLDAALLALRRECVIRDAIPLIAEAHDVVSGPEEQAGRLRRLSLFLDETAGPVVITTSRSGLDLGTSRRCLRVDWPAPEYATRRQLWVDTLGSEAEALGSELDAVAHRYRLGPGGIRRAAAAARLLAGSRQQTLEPGDLVRGVRNDIAERVGSLATRVEVKQSWDDLVLSEDLLDQIRGLTARVRHAHRVYEDWGFHRKVARGVGVPALFSGPPGTGKTMVAGLIARDLDLELLQVDLSQVVSKWIGETEKQLARVFDAAEAGHALLLFDEADSLFAKRSTEIRGATDRYANLEVNYLLQRVESFGGIVILTTNLETSIDTALKRRLAAHITFWPPDEDEREELWRRMLTTPGAPVDLDTLDLESLARDYSDMTGANIRNAVLAAAFLAAAEDTEITQDHLARAAKGEYRTMGRILR